MRKVTEKAIAAFMSDMKFTESNTSVEVSNGETVLKLHGNAIAMKKDGTITITNAGWATNTTKERLNGIPGVSIYQKKGEWYLNGNQWDGDWIEI